MTATAVECLFSEAECTIWVDTTTARIAIRFDDDETYYSLTATEAVGFAAQLLMAAHRALTITPVLQ